MAAFTETGVFLTLHVSRDANGRVLILCDGQSLADIDGQPTPLRAVSSDMTGIPSADQMALIGQLLDVAQVWAMQYFAIPLPPGVAAPELG